MKKMKIGRMASACNIQSYLNKPYITAFQAKIHIARLYV